MAAAFQELMPYGASIYYGISSMIKGFSDSGSNVHLSCSVSK